ncbi:MAG: hypothetical protein K0Q76_2226 [Panacagrimonas sp.]|nr:hypothetical protein [Panacagrimonas sp.]MCC2657118.1 hypothetical protein [Panacagrimonas sp.]
MAGRNTAWNVAIAGVAFAVYLLTLTHNFTDGEDALRYVRDITTGQNLWVFGNHLLFNIVGVSWYGLWTALGHADDALIPMQVLSAACAGISVGLMAWIGALLRLPRALALSATLGAAVSSSFWAYAVLPDTYLLPMPFVLFGFGCLLRALAASGESPTAWVIGATLSWSLATLLHQQNVLFFGPGALMLIMGSGDRRAGFGRAALLLGVGGALTLGCYILVAVYGLGLRTIPAFIGWTLGYAKDGPWTPWSWVSLPKGVIGLVRAIFAVNLALGVDSIAQLAQRALPNMILVEERYFTAFLRPAVLYASLAMLVASAVVVVALLGVLLRRVFVARGAEVASHGAMWLGWMIASQAIAVVAWEPINPEFWIAVLPWSWLLVALAIDRHGDRLARNLWFAFIVLLGMTNAVGYVIPQTDPESDYWHGVNALPLSLLRQGDQIVSMGGYVSDGYLALQTRREIINGAYGIAEVRKMIEDTPSDTRLLVSSWWIDPPAFLVGNTQLELWDRDQALRLLDCYRPNLTELGRAGDQTVWELRRPLPTCPAS